MSCFTLESATRSASQNMLLRPQHSSQPYPITPHLHQCSTESTTSLGFSLGDTLVFESSLVLFNATPSRRPYTATSAPGLSCFLALVLLGSFHPPSLSYSLGPLLHSQEILTLFSLTAAIVNKEKSSLCGCFYGKHTLFNIPSITCLTSFFYLTIIKPDFICTHSKFPDAQYTSLQSYFEAVMCLQVCFSVGSLCLWK